MARKINYKDLIVGYNGVSTKTINYPLASGDSNTLISFNSSRMQTLTIPANAGFRQGALVGVSFSDRVCEIRGDLNVRITAYSKGKLVESKRGLRGLYPDPNQQCGITFIRTVVETDPLTKLPVNIDEYVVKGIQALTDVRQAAEFEFVFDPTIAANITYSSGTNVATYTDKGASTDPAAQPSLNAAGSGTAITCDGTGFTFANGNYFAASNPALFQNALSRLQDFSFMVMAEYKLEADVANGATMAHMRLAGTDTFICQTRGGAIRFGSFTGSAYDNLRQVSMPPYNASNDLRRTLYHFGHNASNPTAPYLRFNTGVQAPSTATNPTAPSSTLGFAIGAETGGGRLFTGKISWLGIAKEQLNEAEAYAVENIVAKIAFACGAGQSNEANKHSTTAPYFRDGARAFIDYRNNQDPRNLTYYFNAAVSGSSLSRKVNDYLYPSTPNNSWVDDRVAGAFVPDVLLNNLVTQIEATLGLGRWESFNFIIGNLENEFLAYNLTGDETVVTKAQVKAAYAYLLDYLQSRYPNARFFMSYITKRNNTSGANWQWIRNIADEILVDQASRLNFGADFVMEDLQIEDTTHYSPLGYANQSRRMARAVFGNVKASFMTSASLSGTTLTINTSDAHGNSFNNANLRAVGSLIATNSQAFNAWTAGTGASTTINNTTDPAGTTNADLLTKTAVTTASIYDVFTGTAAIYNYSVFVKAGTATKITLGLSADNGATFRGQIEFDLTARTATDRSSVALVAGSAKIDVLTLTNGGSQWYRVSFAATLTAASYRAYIIPDAVGGATAGNLWLYGASVTLGVDLRDYHGTASARSFIRIFSKVGGVLTELSTTNTVIGINTITWTLSSAPATGTAIEVYAFYGSGQDTQRHTVPQSNLVAANDNNNQFNMRPCRTALVA